MEVSIWAKLIVIAVGIWDLIIAYNRWPKKKDNKQASKEDSTVRTTADVASAFLGGGGPRGAKAFLILGIIFTVAGIIILFI